MAGGAPGVKHRHRDSVSNGIQTAQRDSRVNFQFYDSIPNVRSLSISSDRIVQEIDPFLEPTGKIIL